MPNSRAPAPTPPSSRRPRRARRPKLGEFTPLERIAVRNVVLREWRRFFTADERDLLIYIVDNSIEWGRPALEATFSQMKKGEEAEDGCGWSWKLPPIGIPRRTFYRVVERLKARGVLFVEPVQRRFTRYRINLEWTPLPGLVPSPASAIETANMPDSEEPGRPTLRVVSD